MRRALPSKRYPQHGAQEQKKVGEQFRASLALFGELLGVLDMTDGDQAEDYADDHAPPRHRTLPSARRGPVRWPWPPLSKSGGQNPMSCHVGTSPCSRCLRL
jgi:hypothetical protein